MSFTADSNRFQRAVIFCLCMCFCAYKKLLHWMKLLHGKWGERKKKKAHWYRQRTPSVVCAIDEKSVCRKMNQHPQHTSNSKYSGLYTAKAESYIYVCVSQSSGEKCEFINSEHETQFFVVGFFPSFSRFLPLCLARSVLVKAIHSELTLYLTLAKNIRAYEWMDGWTRPRRPLYCE